MTHEELDKDIATCKRKIAHYEEMLSVKQEDMLVGSVQELHSGAKSFLKKFQRDLEILTLAKRGLGVI
jgi:hypothetical protein